MIWYFGNSKFKSLQIWYHSKNKQTNKYFHCELMLHIRRASWERWVENIVCRITAHPMWMIKWMWNSSLGVCGFIVPRVEIPFIALCIFHVRFICPKIVESNRWDSVSLSVDVYGISQNAPFMLSLSLSYTHSSKQMPMENIKLTLFIIVQMHIFFILLHHRKHHSRLKSVNI